MGCTFLYSLAAYPLLWICLFICKKVLTSLTFKFTYWAMKLINSIEVGLQTWNKASVLQCLQSIVYNNWSMSAAPRIQLRECKIWKFPQKVRMINPKDLRTTLLWNSIPKLPKYLAKTKQETKLQPLPRAIHLLKSLLNYLEFQFVAESSQNFAFILREVNLRLGCIPLSKI